MKTIDFAHAACEKVRRYMDSYISNELLVETNHEVLQHLEGCSSCAAELEVRLRIRKSLQNAVRAETAQPGLQAKIQARIRDHELEAPARWVAPRWFLAIAAMLLLTAGLWVPVQFWRARSQQDAFIQTLSARLATVLRVGLADHIHCAVFRKYQKDPPSVQQMQSTLGPRYSRLVSVAADRVPRDYRLVIGHQCSYRGRRYIHLAFRGESALMSLVITRKNAGESFTKENLVPLLREAGVAIYGARTGQFQVSGFETADYLVYVVSDLAKENNLQMTASLAPAVRDFLGRL